MDVGCPREGEAMAKRQHRANPLPRSASGPYAGGMILSAHDVAAALRERYPGLPQVKLQKLLYYCQGHHLAATGQALFGEEIQAWEMGPVVPELWRAEKAEGPKQCYPELNEAQANTIGYVLSRYGSLTGKD